MNIKFLIDFEEIVSYASVSTNEDLLLTVNNLIETENCNYIAPDEIDKIIIRIQPSLNNIDLEAWLGSTLLDHASGDVDTFPSELERILEDGEEPLVVYGNVVETSVFIKLIKYDAVNMDIEGLTGIILYRQNSANNVVNKTLTLSNIIQGKFNIPIALKSFTLDLDGKYVFNYIWIPLLNRYYYVNSIQKYTDKLTRYTFGEDVLMSWQSLIKSQSAFVTRQADGNDYLVDNRFPLENIYTVDHLDGSIIDTPSAQSKVNCVLNFDINLNVNPRFNFLVSTKLLHKSGDDIPSDYPQSSQVYFESINAPDNYLPKITNHTAPQTINYFIDQTRVEKLINACMLDDSTASFIDNIMWLPFEPSTVFPLATADYFHLFVGNKWLEASPALAGSFKNYNEAAGMVYGFYSYTKDDVKYRIDNFPYLIIRDFTIAPIHENWRDYEPYTVYEIWVPFCQWVKINAVDLFDNSGNSNRILIYYSLDISSGQATAYIYNYSMKYIIWSGACQMGVKLDLSLTNANENIKQKQSNALNTALGMISSAVSVAIGVASENPVAIVGGVLSASKTLASAVNTNRMILDRNTTTFGSNDGALFATNKVALRITQLLDEHTTEEKAIFYAMNGKPLNKYISLSGLSGYTEIGDIHFNPMNYDITQDEINEIVAILRNGVIM